MGQPIVQQFTTEADTTGIETVKSGMKDVEEQSKSTFSNISEGASMASGSFERLARRIERPIAAIAYSGLAEQLSGLATKGEKTGAVLHNIFHAAGNALMFFNPPLGLAVISGTALFEIFEKLGQAKTAEEFQKEADALQKEYEAANKLIPILLAKSDLDKKTKDRLKEELEATNESSEAFKNHYEMVEKNITARGDLITSLQKEVFEMAGGKQAFDQWRASGDDMALSLDKMGDKTASFFQKAKELNILTKKQAEDQNFLNGSQATYLSLQETPKDNTAIFQKQHEIKMQALVDSHDLVEAQRQEAIAAQFLADTQQKIMTTTDPKLLKQYEDQYDKITKLDSMLKTHIADLQQNQSDEDQILGSMAESWTNYAQTMGGALATGSQTAKSVLDQMMKEQLKIVGDGLIKQLSAKALASMADPLTVAVGLAEIAAIGAIEAITGASGGGSVPTAPPTAVSQPTTTQMTMVNVNFQGGNLADPGAIAIIMKGITKQTVQGNGQTVVTQIVGNGPPPPGSLA